MDEQNEVLFTSADLETTEERPIDIPTPDNFDKLFDKCPEEVKDYIIALEEKYLETQNNLKRSVEQTNKAYESKRALDQQYQNYRTVAEQKLMFVQSAVNNIQQAMRLIGGNI